MARLMRNRAISNPPAISLGSLTFEDTLANSNQPQSFSSQRSFSVSFAQRQQQQLQQQQQQSYEDRLDAFIRTYASAKNISRGYRWTESRSTVLLGAMIGAGLKEPESHIKDKIMVHVGELSFLPPAAP